eukprot:CAMPEP_0117046430 /NCGR_PEP_ID=MMETSP0472-20121206/32109_1 /TAXON_ID=693140 ORGANISM="Tiarina fusus, Strain LIS" /NCGR_SAMPLE_ID=MMETSP0472 /ASSEMBLY_ACC=CAM_ASM_000603 /LENGTH=146 /DNA_ID=CAMNT_0004758789 /DNA_START=81 /DNA_END=521 /DNA_ORIENTATION=-
MAFPNPASFAKGDKNEIPEVEQLGTITLEQLNAYHCNNEERRLLSLFGDVFDVTSSEKGYGKEGAYKEYAGHDITLAISLMKTDEQWLDKFVKMEKKWIDDAKGWVDYMECKYPRCGKLDKWEEDPESWPELTPEEKEAINKCVIM